MRYREWRREMDRLRGEAQAALNRFLANPTSPELAADVTAKIDRVDELLHQEPPQSVASMVWDGLRSSSVPGVVMGVAAIVAIWAFTFWLIYEL